MHNRYADLNPEKALIFRIIHRDNLPWVMDNGLYCGNSEVKAPDWVNIGNPELISKRAAHTVQTPPGGFLNDYVPFLLHALLAHAAEHQDWPRRHPQTQQ